MVSVIGTNWNHVKRELIGIKIKQIKEEALSRDNIDSKICIVVKEI